MEMDYTIHIADVTCSHPGYEAVIRWQVDNVIGYTVIHSFVKPNNVAAGGTRIMCYNSESDALIDSLDLALTMTKKMKMAGVNIGGAKTVVNVEKLTPVQIRKGLWGVSEILKYFKGNFITGSDLNTGEEEIEQIYSFIKDNPQHIQRCLIREKEVKVSRATAYGVVGAIKAVVKSLSLPHLPRVIIQGFGKVGSSVAQLLRTEAMVTVTDISSERQQEAIQQGFDVVLPEDAYTFCSEIFIPCAESRVFTLERLKCLNTKVICGCTNNPFASEDTGLPIISQKQIIYVPDYIVNSGGALRVESHYFSINRTDEDIQRIIFNQVLKHLEQ